MDKKLQLFKIVNKWILNKNIIYARKNLCLNIIGDKVKANLK